MEQDQPESDAGAGVDTMTGVRDRWAALDPALRKQIVWITTAAVIVLIVLAVFALGFAGGKCLRC